MHAKEKVKMCPHCEGGIPVDATECRYCGSSLKSSKGRKGAYQAEDSLASLYEPPYAPAKKASQYGIATDSLYHHQEDEREEEREIPPKKMGKYGSTTAAPIDKEQEEEEKAHIGSLLLLSIGGQLFTLAWLQFFFSDHGFLTLEWKSRFWPIYLLISLPLLYQGYKRL